MKNLKKILLLGIMLVNLMPYLKDGKVELKSTEIAAQTYLCESELLDFASIFRKHKCVNTQDSNDWFWGKSHSCTISPGQCICSECHNLFPCDGSSNICGCGASISKSMTVYGGEISSSSENWCTFAIIAKITTVNVVNNNMGDIQQFGGGGSIPAATCDSIAKNYFKNVSIPRIHDWNVMIENRFDNVHLNSFFGNYSISVNTGFVRAEELIDKMNDGSGCLFYTRYDGGHHMLGYRLSKSTNESNSEAKLHFYDPARRYDDLRLNHGDKSVQSEMARGEFVHNNMVK